MTGPTHLPPAGTQDASASRATEAGGRPMILIRIADPVRRRPWAGYLLALVALLVEFGGFGLYMETLRDFPFLLPVTAVTVVAFFGGWKPATLVALASEPFLLSPRHLGPSFSDHILSLCQQAGFSPNVTQEAIQMQTLVGLVAAGFGVCLVPASLRQLQQEGVVYCELHDVPAFMELALAWRRDETNPALFTFLDVTRDHLSSLHTS